LLFSIETSAQQLLSAMGSTSGNNSDRTTNQDGEWKQEVNGSLNKLVLAKCPPLKPLYCCHKKSAVSVMQG